MATVYVAADVKHDRQVAIKVLRPDVARAVGSERFLREIGIAARLSHPHILSLHDSGDAEGVLHYVMPYVEGPSLEQEISRGPLALDRALEIIRQTACGLGFAHAQDIVHRDVKPGNILLNGEFALVADFGVALAVASADGTRLTETGVALGTPHYMSPEQGLGDHAIDGRSDQYSLACVLYEMLTGEPPFAAANVRAILVRHALDEPPPIRRLRSTVPPALEDVVARAMAKAPQDRFDDIEGFARAVLSACASDGGGAARSATGAPSTREVVGAPEDAACDPNRIAVLPFVNMSADIENEYFSDGMTEELIAALANVDGLRVASRTSAFSFKGQDGDIRQIGRSLNVGTVMEGSVRKAGDRLRLTAQLIEVETGHHLWSGTFDRELEDVFEIQEQIARSIVETLVPTLSTSAQPIVRKSTSNLDAYNLYLKGRYAWNKRTESGFRAAVEYFESALEADPAFAEAWAGLADAYTLLGIAEYGFAPPRDVMPRARRAARRALELDPGLAEAQTSIAHITAFYEWDVERAEAAFRHAIELDPEYAFAYHWYALLLAALGRHDEALAAELKARELEPLSLIINKNVGTILYYGRRHAESLEEYEAALKLDPDYPRTLLYAALAFDVAADYEGATQKMKEALSYDPDNHVIRAALGYTHALAGNRERALEIVEEIKGVMEDRYVPAFNLALIYAGLEEPDRAYEWLERAFEERSSWLLSLGVEPAFDGMRDDPRFDALVARVTSGTPPEAGPVDGRR